LEEVYTVCSGCGLPIEPGEPRWTGHEPLEAWHYTCAEEVDLTKSIAVAFPSARQGRA